MESVCKKHEKRIHHCIENIINTFKQDVLLVPNKDQEPRITVSCKQVDVILVYAAAAKYHPADHAPEWESVVYKHHPDLACEKCGNFFTNIVIERARKLQIL
ncbi:hypothetical protein A2Z10_01795 [Candidatus Azambacteria bacterium RBG_16_47_10]|uniref:Uncharacterized protein n=1 Tax=Candidatus Azambacteria bacterium RBG_16_47_10 TaxID=1797292 RepID=A0A1F5AZJ2_9BACT|nr:MAG: hypothetical protein A2Z10_01795 [Candidatus Azambacteria bacterium RBG_16_47_10]